MVLPNLKFWLCCVKHTTESNFSNFVIKYLGEIDTEFENTLPCLSGAQMGLNHGKKIEVKNLVKWNEIGQKQQALTKVAELEDTT